MYRKLKPISFLIILILFVFGETHLSDYTLVPQPSFLAPGSSVRQSGSRGAKLQGKIIPKPATRDPHRELINPEEIHNEIKWDPRTYPQVITTFDPFRTFMNKLLYHHPWGFYNNVRTQIGPEGDFWTYPQVISPFFGQMVAEHAFKMYQGMRSAGTLTEAEAFAIVEFGAGTGDLAFDILNYIQQRAKSDPPWELFYRRLRYLTIEISPHFRRLQIKKNLTFRPIFQTRSGDARNPLSTLARDSIKGLILSNELVDAFGVHKVILTQEGRAEVAFVMPRVEKDLVITLSGEGAPANLIKLIQSEDRRIREEFGLGESIRFDYLTSAVFESILNFISTRFPVEKYERFIDWFYFDETYVPVTFIPELAAHFQENVEGYSLGLAQIKEDAVVYVNIDAERFVEGLSQVLKSGYVITIDYGMDILDLILHAQKYSTISMMSANREDLFNLYEKITIYDLTTHQNFTALAQKGNRIGLKLIHYGPQGHLASGTSVDLSKMPLSNFKSGKYVTRSKIKEFLGLESEFKILVQQKVGTDPTYVFPGRESGIQLSSPIIPSETTRWLDKRILLDAKKLRSKFRRNLREKHPPHWLNEKDETEIEKGL